MNLGISKFLKVYPNFFLWSTFKGRREKKKKASAEEKKANCNTHGTTLEVCDQVLMKWKKEWKENCACLE